MSDCVVQCHQVWKKFTRGERNDSLRDAIPDLIRWLARRPVSDELTKRQFWALRDVSFQLQRGEALGVIGPNGAGKSTLLKLLSRILVPNKGSIAVNGRLTALIEVGAGFHQDLTGRENVYLNGAILGMTRKEINRRIGEIVEFAGVEEFIDTPVKRYSSGMQARLGFSVAAHMDPEILLVDEVLAVGDAQFQQKCLDRMRFFANSGRSIIFISHNLQAVSELCPETMLLKNGQCLMRGSTPETIKHYLSLVHEHDESSQSGTIQIRRVRLLDERGCECSRFAAGTRAKLAFDLQIDETPSRYFLGFALKRITDDLLVADYNLDLPLDDSWQGPISMELDFDVNLLTGAYGVTLFVEHKATYHKPVYLDLIKFFDVAERSACAGVVHVSPQITLKPQLITAAGS